MQLTHWRANPWVYSFPEICSVISTNWGFWTVQKKAVDRAPTGVKAITSFFDPRRTNTKVRYLSAIRATCDGELQTCKTIPESQDNVDLRFLNVRLTRETEFGEM